VVMIMRKTRVGILELGAYQPKCRRVKLKFGEG